MTVTFYPFAEDKEVVKFDNVQFFQLTTSTKSYEVVTEAGLRFWLSTADYAFTVEK